MTPRNRPRLPTEVRSRCKEGESPDQQAVRSGEDRGPKEPRRKDAHRFVSLDGFYFPRKAQQSRHQQELEQSGLEAAGGPNRKASCRSQKECRQKSNPELAARSANNNEPDHETEQRGGCSDGQDRRCALRGETHSIQAREDQYPEQV